MANLGQAEVIKWMNAFSGDYDKLVATLSRIIRKNIAEGMSATAATEAAFGTVGYQGRMEKWVIRGVSSIVSSTASVTLDPKAFREVWLNQAWSGFQQPLKTLLQGTETQQIVAQSIAKSMRDAEAWRTAAKSLTDSDLMSGDIAKHMTELETLARRVIGGDKEAMGAYRAALAKSEREIARLAQNDAPTARLQAAYERVIAAAERGSASGLDKAIESAIDAKARYNAERIARTEMAKAYGAGTKDKILKDDDAVGFRSVLSSRHEDEDICDFWAESDLYGMGPGVYPKHESPPYPYHPHCLCILQPVYRMPEGAHPEYSDPEAGKEYLASLDQEKREALLGVQGAKEFAENPEGWKGQLNNFAESVPTKPLPPIVTEGGIGGGGGAPTPPPAPPTPPPVEPRASAGETAARAAASAAKATTPKAPKEFSPESAYKKADTKIGKATTTDEVAKAFNTSWGRKTADFTGMDVAAAKAQAAAMNQLYKKYPFLRNDLKKSVTNDVAEGKRLKHVQTTYAHADLNARKVVSNTVYFKDYEKLTAQLKNDCAANWHPIELLSGKVGGSVTVHEIGHIVDEVIRMAARGSGTFTITDAIKAEAIEIRSFVNVYWNSGAYNVSRYGKKNSLEWFAETFSLYNSGVPAANLSKFNDTLGAFMMKLDTFLKHYTEMRKAQGNL